MKSRYQWLANALADGGVVVTASRRLSRELRKAHGEFQLASGRKAWSTPDIQFINDWLAQTRVAAVNFVSESQKNLLGHFGRGFDPDQPAFEGLETTTGKTGVPLLADCLGSLEGELVESLDTGDHRIHLFKVVAGGIGPRLADETPMVHIRKNGFNY